MNAAAHCLQFAGLIVGFAGALRLTISQRPGDLPGNQILVRGTYIVLARPRLWKLGLWLLVADFVIKLPGQRVR
jgi:hypothetical protein